MREVKMPDMKPWLGAALTLLVFRAGFGSELLAIKSPPEFKPITTAEKPTCSKPNSICWLNEGKDEKFSLWFDSTVDRAQNYRSITKIHIKNNKSGEVQSFDVPGVSRVDLNERVGIYKTQLRKDGPSDLALFTNLSPHHGPLFYYFIFDAATKKFVMTNEEIPKLDFTDKNGLYASDTRKEIQYELGSDLYLKQKFSSGEDGKSGKKVK